MGLDLLVNAVIRALNLDKGELQRQAKEAWETYQGFANNIQLLAQQSVAILSKLDHIEVLIIAKARETGLKDLALADREALADMADAGDANAAAALSLPPNHDMSDVPARFSDHAR